MTLIIRSVTNLRSVNIPFTVPTLSAVLPPVVLAPFATLDLLSTMTEDDLIALQHLLNQLVAAGSISVSATIDTSEFESGYTGGGGSVGAGTQFQLAYYATTGSAVSGLTTPTPNSALVSDANGLPVASSTTATELGFVHSVTSSIQTQLNTKLSTAVTALHADSHTNLTGAVQLVSGTNVTLSQVGQAITINAASGSTPPAGSNTDIQFNNSGAFGASANLTWDGTTFSVTGMTHVTNNLTVDTQVVTDAVHGRTGALTLSPFSDSGAAIKLTTASGTSVMDIDTSNSDVIIHVVTNPGFPVLVLRGNNGNLGNGQALAFQSATTKEWWLLGNSTSNGSSNDGFALFDRDTATNAWHVSDTHQLSIDTGGAHTNKLDVNGNAAIGSGYAGISGAPTNGLIVQGNVSIGFPTPDASAVLEVTSTTQGFLPPRMTTTQRNAISSPAEGLIVYDTTLHQTWQWQNGAWAEVGGGSTPTVSDSTATVGGAATESVAVAGLLTTSTIWAVTQRTAGGAALPLLAWTNTTNGHLNIIYSADMGSGAVVRVLFIP